jgi:hypothetical protein
MANFLPIMNPLYGEGKYDGRFDKELLKKTNEA